MAIKRNPSLALFLLLNLIFFSLTSAWTYPSPKPGSRSPPNPKPRTPPSPYLGTPPPGQQPGTPPGPQPGTPPGQPPATPPSPQAGNACPRDALKLGICADVLGGLVNLTIGTPPVTPCCTLIEGLADLEAAICLCTVIRANILGISINLPIFLSLLLNVCSREVPRDFVCA